MEAPEGIVDVVKKLDEIEQNHKEGQAIQRSQRLRADAGWLPENAVKTRKAFYCNVKDGYLNKKMEKAAAPAMGPDMMGTMMKQNLMGIVNMFMFQGIGSVFQGFVLGRIPIPLGVKFKPMLQQGILCQTMDPTYVSSMSWAFLLIYGLGGVISLVLSDSKSVAELEALSNGGAMMMQQQ